MIFRLAKKEEARQIAEIHKQEIKKGFLSSLNIFFLTTLYSAIIKSTSSFCVVAEEGGRVIGFIAGSKNLKEFYRYFLKRYFIQAIFILLPQVFNLQKLRKIFEALFYPQKEKDLPEAELLTIAVKKDYQGQGIAGQMLFKFIVEMKNRKVKIFKVLVGSELEPAVKFYKKNGFEFVKDINVHKNQVSHVYIYDLESGI